MVRKGEKGWLVVDGSNWRTVNTLSTELLAIEFAKGADKTDRPSVVREATKPRRKRSRSPAPYNVYHVDPAVLKDYGTDYAIAISRQGSS
jgi:hypothetical protein